VIYKTFGLETNPAFSNQGGPYVMTQFYKNSQGATKWGQKYFFGVISNECNRIHLKSPAFEMVLIR